MSSQHPLPHFVDALFVLAGPGAHVSRVLNAAALLVDVDAELLPDNHRALLVRFRKVMSPTLRALLPVSDAEARFWAGWIAETTLDLTRGAQRAVNSAPRSIAPAASRPSVAPH